MSFWTDTIGETRECDICVSLDGDHSPKEGVKLCRGCGKWMCPRCKTSPRRMLAFAKHVGGKVAAFIRERLGKAA